MPVQIMQSTPIDLIPAGTAVGAPSTGATFAAPVPACLVTWQVLYGVAPASVTIELQASNDGTNFTPIDNTTTLVSGSVRITASSARFLRAVMTAVAGGSTWQIIVSASPMGVGRDLYANNEVKIGGSPLRVGLTGTTTAEEILFSMGINARSFVTSGASIKIIAFGTTAANAAVKTIRMKAVGNVTDSYVALNAGVSGLDWSSEYLITRRSFGQFVRRGYTFLTGVTPGLSFAAAGIDETVAWSLQITGAVGTTGTVDNIVLHNVIVTTIPGIPNII